MLHNKQRPRYSLADLLAECKPDESMPVDVAWEQMPEVGKELWPGLAEDSPVERNDQGKSKA